MIFHPSSIYKGYVVLTNYAPFPYGECEVEITSNAIKWRLANSDSIIEDSLTIAKTTKLQDTWTFQINEDVSFDLIEIQDNQEPPSLWRDLLPFEVGSIRAVLDWKKFGFSQRICVLTKNPLNRESLLLPEIINNEEILRSIPKLNHHL